MGSFEFALGCNAPANISDLHIFRNDFPDSRCFAFFRSSPNSIRQLLADPIYELTGRKVECNLLERKSWKDLHHMGLVTNLSVYVRTDINKENTVGELWVDPEFNFIFVSYAAM